MFTFNNKLKCCLTHAIHILMDGLNRMRWIDNIDWIRALERENDFYTSEALKIVNIAIKTSNRKCGIEMARECREKHWIFCDICLSLCVYWWQWLSQYFQILIMNSMKHWLLKKKATLIERLDVSQNCSTVSYESMISNH